MTAMLMENMALLAGAPNGIAVIRSLILDLAVSGRLMRQQSDKSDNSTIEISIPSRYTTTLSKLGRWAVGSGFPTSEQGKTGLPILFCKVSDMNLIGNEKFIRRTNNTIDEATAKLLRVNVHPAGTVVFPKIGGAIATNKRRIICRPTAIDNNCLGITPFDATSSDYLYLLLASIDFARYQAGTAVPALSQAVLGELICRLPPLLEQNCIVTKVDELMALCDRLETRQSDAQAAHARLVDELLGSLLQARDAEDFAECWGRVKGSFELIFTTETSIESLRQLILQLGIHGLLCETMPSDGDSKTLIHSISTARTSAWNAGLSPKSKEFSPIEEKEAPRSLPPSWSWARLGQLGITATGSTPATHETDAFGGPTPFIGPGQITASGIISPGEKSLSDAGLSFSTIAQPGDLLMVCIGGSIGKLAMADRTLAFNQQINSLSVIEAEPKFIFFVMSCPEFQRAVLAAATGSATPIINKSKWENIPVPIPPLATQHRIVAKLDELLALCDRLKVRIRQARQVQERLAGTLVERAVL